MSLIQIKMQLFKMIFSVYYLDAPNSYEMHFGIGRVVPELIRGGRRRCHFFFLKTPPPSLKIAIITVLQA